LQKQSLLGTRTTIATALPLIAIWKQTHNRQQFRAAAAAATRKLGCDQNAYPNCCLHVVAIIIIVVVIIITDLTIAMQETQTNKRESREAESPRHKYVTHCFNKFLVCFNQTTNCVLLVVSDANLISAPLYTKSNKHNALDSIH
jgi:hypothetical protein